MLITYDTEFLDDGKTIELISIALVTPHGDDLYYANSEADWERINREPWLVANVLKHLPMKTEDGILVPDPNSSPWASRDAIAYGVERFLKEQGGPNDVELWAYYPATDHVAMYQLFGPMIECTSHGMPMRTSCLRQEEESVKRQIRRAVPMLKGPGSSSESLQHLAVSAIGEWTYRRPEQDPATEHHALHDARHDMALARWLGLVS